MKFLSSDVILNKNLGILKRNTFYPKKNFDISSKYLCFSTVIFNSITVLLLTMLIYVISLLQVFPWDTGYLQKHKIVLFLQQSLNKSQIDLLKKNLIKKKGIKELNLIERQEAFEQFSHALNINYMSKKNEKVDFSYLEKELPHILEVTLSFSQLRWQDLKSLVQEFNTASNIAYIAFDEENFKIIYDDFYKYQTVRFYMSIGLTLLNTILLILHLSFLSKPHQPFRLLLFKSFLYSIFITGANSILFQYHHIFLKYFFHSSIIQNLWNKNLYQIMLKNNLIAFSISILWIHFLLKHDTNIS